MVAVNEAQTVGAEQPDTRRITGSGNLGLQSGARSADFPEAGSDHSNCSNARSNGFAHGRLNRPHRYRDDAPVNLPFICFQVREASHSEHFAGRRIDGHNPAGEAAGNEVGQDLVTHCPGEREAPITAMVSEVNKASSICSFHGPGDQAPSRLTRTTA